MEARANLEQRVHHLKEVAKTEEAKDKEESLDGADKVHSLRQMTVRLLRELHSLGEVRNMDVSEGVDFYTAYAVCPDLSPYERYLRRQLSPHRGQANKRSQ